MRAARSNQKTINAGIKTVISFTWYVRLREACFVSFQVFTFTRTMTILLFLTLVTASASDPRPSVILILADDLGWGDLSAWGSQDIRTPVLDDLARRGSSFTRFYTVSPVCSPSRASLLTGLLPPRTGVFRVFRPGAETGLPDEHLTLGEALRAQGYVTAAIGKWHLGDAPSFLPTRHGFDEFFGIPYSNDMVPLRLLRNAEMIDPNPTQPFLTREFTDEAIGFLSRNAQRPFFLYLPLKTPHVPLALPDAWRRPERSAYIDSVEYMDWSIGRILKRLEDLNLARQTIVIFTSDNGSWRRGSNGGLRAGKKTVYEGGVRVPLMISYPEFISENRKIASPAMMCDLFPTILLLIGGTEPEGLDGRHLLDVLGVEGSRGSPGRRPDDPIFFFLKRRVAAVRSGRWKLHIEPAGSIPDTPNQLFDLVSDPGESRNLIAEKPKVAARLLQLVREYEGGTGLASYRLPVPGF